MNAGDDSQHAAPPPGEAPAPGGGFEIADVAERVAEALASGDLSAYSSMLSDDVRWTPRHEPTSGCRNREEVLDWYRRAQAAGADAIVTEVVAGESAILVGLQVTGTEAARAAGATADRWQVMDVRDGRVCEITGFDDRAEAAARAGVD